MALSALLLKRAQIFSCASLILRKPEEKNMIKRFAIMRRLNNLHRDENYIQIYLKYYFSSRKFL